MSIAILAMAKTKQLVEAKHAELMQKNKPVMKRTY